MRTQRLWTTVTGSTAPDRQRLVFLHGFTQTAVSWLPLAHRLVDRAPVEATVFDLPGHGRSGNVVAGLSETAELVAAAGRATYIGYSMGARIALHVALAHPELVERLVLVGGTAGLDRESERAERRAADEALAQRVLSEGVPDFVQSWMSGPLFRTLRATEADVAARLTNTPEGLAMSLRLCGTGSQQPLWEKLRELTIPTLATAGSEDTKFTSLGHRLTDAIGTHARFHGIPDAGHAAHLEQPDAFLAELRRFLRLPLQPS